MKLKISRNSQSKVEYSKAKKAMEEKIIAPDYLYVYNSESKGRGIKTKKAFRKGEYVLFYSGVITSSISAKENFFFQISAGKNPKYIDCSEDDGSYGRLLNDNHFNPNLKVVPVRNADGDLIPVFFALRDIGVDEPLEFDYGGPSLFYSWRNKRSSPTDTKKPSRKRLKEEEELGSKKAKCSVAADLERPETLADHEPYLCWMELPNQEDKVSNIKGDLEEKIEDILDNLTATCEKLKEVSEMQDSTNIQVNSLSGAMNERIRDLSDLQQDTTLQISSFSGVADERLKEVAEIQKATSLQMESLSVSTNERFKEVSDIQKGTSLQISSLSSSVKERLGEISGMQGISSTQIASLSSATNERFNEVSNIQRETLLQMESSSKSVSEQFKEVSGIQKSSSLQLSSLSSSTNEILNEVSKIQETSAQQISSLSSAIKDQVEEVSLVHKNLTQNVEGIVSSTDEKLKEALELQTKTFHKMDHLTESSCQKFRELDKMQDVSNQQLNSFSSSTKDWLKEISEAQKVSCLQINSLSSFMNDKLRGVLELHSATNKQINLMSSVMNENFSKNFSFQDKTNQQIDKLSHLTFEHLRKSLDAQETSTSKMNQLSLSTDEKFRNVAEMQQASVQIINSLSSSVGEHFKETAMNQKSLSSSVASFVDLVGKQFEDVSDLHKTTGLQLCSTSEQLKEVSEKQKSSADLVTSLSLCLKQQLTEVLEMQKETMLQMASLSNSTNEKFCALTKNIDSLIEEASENRQFMTKAFTALSQKYRDSQSEPSLQERHNNSTNKQESRECDLSECRSPPCELAVMETDPPADKPSSSSQSVDARAALGSSAEETGAGGGPPPLRSPPNPHDAAAAASDHRRTSRTDAGGESHSVHAPDEGGGGRCLEESLPLEECGQPSSDSEEPLSGGWGGRSCLDESPAAKKEEEQSVVETFMRSNRANGEGKSTQDSSLDGGSQQTQEMSTKCEYPMDIIWKKMQSTTIEVMQSIIVKNKNYFTNIITSAIYNKRCEDFKQRSIKGDADVSQYFICFPSEKYGSILMVISQEFEEVFCESWENKDDFPSYVMNVLLPEVMTFRVQRILNCVGMSPSPNCDELFSALRLYADKMGLIVADEESSVNEDSSDEKIKNTDEMDRARMSAEEAVHEELESHKTKKTGQNSNRRRTRSLDKGENSPLVPYSLGEAGKCIRLERPCFFCNVFTPDISKHLLLDHADKPEIKEVMKMKARSSRIKALRKLRVMGIAKANEFRLKNGQEPIFMKRQNLNSKKVICLGCKGIFSSNTIRIHHKTCTASVDERNSSFMTLDEFIKFGKENHSVSFFTDIIEKLPNSEIGNVIRREPLLQDIGKGEFQLLYGKKTERSTRRQVITYMKRIATIFVALNASRRACKQLELQPLQMFNVEHFELLKETILKLSIRSPGKARICGIYDACIRKAAKMLILHYKKSNQEKEKNQVIMFFLHFSQNYLGSLVMPKTKVKKDRKKKKNAQKRKKKTCH